MCVAIVTDDMQTSNKILSMLNNYFLQNGVYTDFELFDKAEPLLHKARDKAYSAVVMQTDNNSCLAEKIQSIDRKCKIILTGANKEDAFIGYELGVCYCCKELLENDLSKILKKYREEAR